MTLREHPDLLQGTDEWLDVRRGIVTASVVGQLVTTRKVGAVDYDCPACGATRNGPCRSKVKKAGVEATEIKTMHPERVALSASNRSMVIEPASNDYSRALTATLVAERITGWTEAQYVSDDMWRGVDDEPRAVAKYAEHYGVEVVKSGFMVEDKWGFQIGYSPDGLVGADGLIEVKSRKPKKHLTTILSNRVPIENMAQIQCGLLVSGRAWCDYLSYCGGMPMWPKRVYPEPQWQDAIIAAVRQFEQSAAEMVALYETATNGLAQTERVVLDNLGLVF